jgi:hypothetical protein
LPLADALPPRAGGLGVEEQKSEEHCVENSKPNTSATEKTDEEIWRAIRDLDPDQQRNARNVACVIAIVVACVVWYWLIFVASK